MTAAGDLARRVALRHLPSWAGALCFCAGGVFTLVVILLMGVPAWALLLVHLADRATGTATLGLMVMACVMATRGSRGPPAARAMAATARQFWQLATTSSLVWLFAALAHLVVQHQAAAATGPRLTLGTYVGGQWQGRLLLLQVVLVAVVVVAAVLTRPGVPRALLSMDVVLVLAAVAICASAWAPSETSTLTRRMLLLGHVLPATLWVGGLFATALVATRLTPDRARLPEIVVIYSRIALAASVCVGLTGLALLAGWIDQHSWLALVQHGDGPLRVGKTVLLVELMAAGALHRKVTIARLETTGDARLLIWVGLGELAVMGVAIALGVTLADNAFAVPAGGG